MSRQFRTSRSGTALALLAVLTLTTAACSNESPEQARFPLEPAQGPVDVDTAALRQAKAAAAIEPCPAGARPRSAASDSITLHSLPAITLPCLGGGESVNLATLSEALGRPVVVNFWAQTCDPCRDEAPLFQQLHERAGSKVAVVGVDLQDPLPDRALAFADELGLTFPQLADPTGATRAPLGLAGLPATFFVAASGEVEHVVLREIKTSADLARLVEEHLGVPASARVGS